ncbi:MAG: N-acetyltransferase [Bacteroidetes bacterium]|nr:MAG: N-acetyltransferase [Bacteroidota bacterium]
MVIKTIQSSQTTNIRHQILRAGQPIETCYYPNDNAPGTFHLGVFVNDELVAIGSFYSENQSDLNYKTQCRFRGIATLPEYRSQGYAYALIGFAINKIKPLGVEAIWCNARTSALGLYKKLGMKVVSDEFEIEGIGPHLVMALEL